MDITFRNSKLAKILCEQKRLEKEYGQEMAKVIRQRLDDLDSAACLADFKDLPGDCHELKGDRKGTISLDLRKQFRLLFKPSGDNPPRLPDGGLDRRRIDAVEIIGVEDTHGK